MQLVRNKCYQIESESRIRDGLRKRLRAPVEVTIEYLQSLPAEPSGKFRHVISEVPIEGGSREASVAVFSSNNTIREDE